MPDIYKLNCILFPALSAPVLPVPFLVCHVPHPEAACTTSGMHATSWPPLIYSILWKLGTVQQSIKDPWSQNEIKQGEACLYSLMVRSPLWKDRDPRCWSLLPVYGLYIKQSMVKKQIILRTEILIQESFLPAECWNQQATKSSSLFFLLSWCTQESHILLLHSVHLQQTSLLPIGWSTCLGCRKGDVNLLRLRRMRIRVSDSGWVLFPRGV